MKIVTEAYAAFDLAKEYPYGNITSFGQGIGFLVPVAFTVAGLAVVFYFFFGALKYLTAGGDKNATAAGKNMITHAIIGFVMLIVLFLLLRFLPEFLGLKGFKLV